jgi:tetratricopeptide (TPR) repeat protein
VNRRPQEVPQRKDVHGGTMNKQIKICVILVLTVVFSMRAFMPQPVFAQTKKGIDLCAAWKFEEAEKTLREALKANPQDILASYYLGLSILMQEKYGEALEVFLKVKDAQDKASQASRSAVPDEHQIQIALAQARLGLKQYDEAWKNLEFAKKEHADSVDTHVYRGVYYLYKEDVKKAIKELDKAISLDEHNAYAHYYAGHAYLRSGNPAKAVEMLKIFLQLAPDAPEAVKAKALIDALC